MDDSYVSLKRRFNDVSKDPSSALGRRMLGDAVGESWDAILPALSSQDERSALVVLAPSGHGKTAELNARSAALQAAGTTSFFIRAVNLAVSGLAGSVHGDEAVRLRAWLSGTEPATIFIDAFDEARLEGHDLEHVLLRFAQEADPSTRRVQLVLSSRNDVWSPNDVRHVVRVLALPTENPPIRIVRLEPLSLEDVQAYAKANGVRDDAAFMRALREEEIDQLFDFRPPDAKVVVDYWKDHGAFGSWSQMLESSIEASVRNENRRHAMQQQFTTEEARSGLARLAAATLLGKRSLISMPGRSNPQEISAERLFADRRPAATEQLLAMGLFAQKGLHSVQLPPGAPSHFLAARWLGERAERGWDPRALENALFVVPFGSGETLIPPSRSQVVGWVAGLVPTMRKRLLKELPHVLLFEGDPAKLSRGECVEALRAVLADIRAGRHDVSPTRGTVRQIAKHDIADAVVRLLHEFAGVPRAEWLLLRIAEVGEYSAVAPVALRLALSATVHDEVAQIAVSVVGAIGGSADRSQLLTLTSHTSEWIRLALVQSLAPETLNGSSLVQLVVSMTSREVAYLLGHALTRVSLPDIDAILVALAPSLRLTNVTSATEPHLEIASRLLSSRLARSTGEIPTWLPPLLLDVESHLTSPFYISSEVVDELKTLVTMRPDLRRALWEERLASSTNASDGAERLLSPKFGVGQPEDLEWFWEKVQTASDDTAKIALGGQLGEILRQMLPGKRLELLRRVDLRPELKAYVEVNESTNAHFDAMRRQNEAKRAAEKAAARAKHIAEAVPLRAQIESGEHAGALIWAWQRLTGTDDRRGRLGTARLVEAVGDELTEVFLTGFRRWWRRHDASVRAPEDRQILHIDLAGLTGISIDFERGLDFSTLTDVEVARAVRYALFELNAFPIWFDALVEAHPPRVRAVLASVVNAEWQSTVEHHGVISRSSNERLPTMELVRELVLEQLEHGPPGHLSTVHDVVDVLIQPPRPGHQGAPLLAREVTAAANGDANLLAEWLRGWSHFAPVDASTWLSRLAASNSSRFLEVVERTAALLEGDFGNHVRPVASGWTAAALERWVRLLHVAIRPEDDIDRVGQGVYSPGTRDRAQEFRSRCIAQLAHDPSREAFEALRRIRRSPEMKPYEKTVDHVQRAQLSVAAEVLAPRWTESDILAVERGDERPPKNSAELFALVQRHLGRVAELIENHDFSYAALFNEKTDEKEIQCWVASSLMLVSRGLYTVEREPEVQDDKLMDISITVPGVGRVPIEIKPLYATRYSFPQLKGFVSDQLVGRYMRPPAVDRGIFLLVPLKSRTWRIEGRVTTFARMRLKLAAHAAKVGAKAYKEVVVASIDVAAARPSKARGSAAAPKKRTRRPRKRTAAKAKRPPRKRAFRT